MFFIGFVSFFLQQQVFDVIWGSDKGLREDVFRINNADGSKLKAFEEFKQMISGFDDKLFKSIKLR